MYVFGVLSQGPHWQTGRVISEQGKPFADHLEYLRSLADAGTLIIGGPFLSYDGGMALFNVASLAEAQGLADRDPAVSAGVLVYELRPILTVIDRVSDDSVDGHFEAVRDAVTAGTARFKR